MKKDDILTSGILELYVAGVLSESENQKIHEQAKNNPQVRKEIEEIENTILALTEVLGTVKPRNFSSLDLNPADSTIKVPFEKKRTSNAFQMQYLAWAASLLLLVGIGIMYVQNKNLKSQLELVQEELKYTDLEVIKERTSKEEFADIIKVLQSDDIELVSLAGQAIAPKSNAKIFWNKETGNIIVDASKLPTPPKGMEYQVWSLKLDPLTPDSIGMLTSFEENQTKIFVLQNQNQSQAFGITLEPKGGSPTPTMEQLYVLGKATNS